MIKDSPINHQFYDTDSEYDNAVPPRSEIPDPEDEQIILCDSCATGNIVLKPYQGNKLICPNCLNVYDPYFEYLKHQDREFTIDSDTATSGILSYGENPVTKTPLSPIRKKLEKDKEPDYVKSEMKMIEYHPGYKTIDIDRKKFPNL